MGLLVKIDQLISVMALGKSRLHHVQPTRSMDPEMCLLLLLVGVATIIWKVASEVTQTIHRPGTSTTTVVTTFTHAHPMTGGWKPIISPQGLRTNVLFHQNNNGTMVVGSKHHRHTLLRQSFGVAIEVQVVVVVDAQHPFYVVARVVTRPKADESDSEKVILGGDEMSTDFAARSVLA